LVGDEAGPTTIHVNPGDCVVLIAQRDATAGPGDVKWLSTGIADLP
jgi:hypothetical protein